MNVNARRRAEARMCQHRRPKEAVEIDDVLADEVMHFGVAFRLPEIVEIEAVGLLAEVLEAGHVADGRVHPNVEELAFGVGDGEAKIRRIAADVPRSETAFQPFRELVGHFGLQRPARRPVAEELVELRQIDEEVLRLAKLRHGVRQHRSRFAKFGGVVGGAADVAVVARLILGPTARASAANLPIRQE